MQLVFSIHNLGQKSMQVLGPVSVVGHTHMSKTARDPTLDALSFFWRET